MKWQANILIVAVLLTTNFATIDGIVLDCTFRVYSFSVVGVRYACVGRVLYDESGNRNVTAVFGLHESGKGPLDVQGIVIGSQNLEFVPTNIESFFPNIIALNFQVNRITTISNRHLIPFPNLQYLWLASNQLTTIDGDLFSGMDSMRLIAFSINNIRHVGHDLNLPINGDIWLSNNACISEDASTPAAVANLKLNLLRNCPPTISQIEDSLERRQNLLTRTYGQIQALQNEQADLLERVAYLERLIGNQLEAKPIKQYLIDAFEKK